MTDKVTVAIVGATGYTGAELLRLLAQHPHVNVTRIVGQSRAGERIADVLPSMRGLYDGTVAAFDADDVASAAQVAFCALPHGASAPIVTALRARGVIVFDLSADFRIADRATYEEWYGPHGAPELIGHATYGLCELHREALRSADLVAVPGCYPTASILALAPLLREQLVVSDGLIVDAKSGASGAGRTPTPSTHLAEAAEGIRAYKAAGQHRHTAEIEQELSRVAASVADAGSHAIRITFTPHLVPMSRGILATGYAVPREPGLDAARCTDAARALYEGSPSVVVLDPDAHPDTAWVRGSNRAFVSYAIDRRTGRVVAQAVIDNLIKGASGQAIQAFNLRHGFDEGMALRTAPLWP